MVTEPPRPPPGNLPSDPPGTVPWARRRRTPLQASAPGTWPSAWPGGVDKAAGLGTQGRGAASWPRGWGPSQAPGAQQPLLSRGLMAAPSEVTAPPRTPRVQPPAWGFSLRVPVVTTGKRPCSRAGRRGKGGDSQVTPHHDGALIPADNPPGRTASPRALDSGRDYREPGSRTFRRQLSSIRPPAFY